MIWLLKKVKMLKTLAIVSGKGGVGKTVVAINLTLILNNLGRRVVLVDGDLRKPNVAIFLGHPKSKGSIHDVLEGKVNIKDVVVVHPSGLKYIAGDTSFERFEKNLIRNFKHNILREIKSEELIVLDTPSGFSHDTKTVLSGVDYALLVTTPEYASVADASKMVRFCNAQKIKVIGVIVNRVHGFPDEMQSSEIQTVLGLPVLASLLEDKEFAQASKRMLPLVYLNPDSDSSMKFKIVAGKLLGEHYEKNVVGKDKWFNYVTKALGLR